MTKVAHWCAWPATAEAYGDRAKNVTRIAEQRKLGRRLVRGHPVIEAEVIYAMQNEMCETPEDFIARRTRLAFVDVAATQQALPRVSGSLFCMTGDRAVLNEGAGVGMRLEFGAWGFHL